MESFSNWDFYNRCFTPSRKSLLKLLCIGYCHTHEWNYLWVVCGGGSGLVLISLLIRCVFPGVWGDPGVPGLGPGRPLPAHHLRHDARPRWLHPLHAAEPGRRRPHRVSACQHRRQMWDPHDRHVGHDANTVVAHGSHLRSAIGYRGRWRYDWWKWYPMPMVDVVTRHTVGLCYDVVARWLRLQLTIIFIVDDSNDHFFDESMNVKMSEIIAKAIISYQSPKWCLKLLYLTSSQGKLNIFILYWSMNQTMNLNFIEVHFWYLDLINDLNDKSIIKMLFD